MAPYDFYRADRKLFLGSGWTHVEVVLKNLNASSELRPIALDRVRRLSVSAEPRSEPLTLFFDNFRLVAGTETPPTTSNQAPEDTLTWVEGRFVAILQVGPQEKIPESVAVTSLRRKAEREYEALKTAIQTADHMGLDTIYSEADKSPPNWDYISARC